MRKNFLRLGAAVMAAVMAMAMPMATPITASAAEEGWRVAELDVKYKLPRYAVSDGYVYDDSVMAGNEFKKGDKLNAKVWFSAASEEGMATYSIYDRSSFLKEVSCPAGYEVKDVAVLNRNMADGSANSNVIWPSSVEVQNSQGLEQPDFSLTEVGGYNDSWIIYADKFSVNYNGTLYPECALYIMGKGVFGLEPYFVVVPQGFDGNIIIKLYGTKLVGGREVKDETTGLIYYLNGSAATAPQQQSATTTEQQPAATEQQPTATVAPQPVAVAEQPPAIPAASQSYYTTKPGDSLMGIAQKTYGDKEKWKDIYELNKGTIKNPNIIWSNMQLQMP